MTQTFKSIVCALMIITLQATVAIAAEVDPKEAKALNKAADEIKTLPGEMDDAIKAFTKSATALNAAVDKAYKDKQFTEKDIKVIEKMAKELDKDAAALLKKCQQVTQKTKKLVATIGGATD